MEKPDERREDEPNDTDDRGRERADMGRAVDEAESGRDAIDEPGRELRPIAVPSLRSDNAEPGRVPPEPSLPAVDRPVVLLPAPHALTRGRAVEGREAMRDAETSIARPSAATSYTRPTSASLMPRLTSCSSRRFASSAAPKMSDPAGVADGRLGLV